VQPKQPPRPFLLIPMPKPEGINSTNLSKVVSQTKLEGGDEMDVLLLLESVVTGVLSVIVKLGGDEPVLDSFMEGVRQRMAEIRLGDLPTDDPQ
jgi:hypothetical protein